jgi:hypothetical protein
VRSSDGFDTDGNDIGNVERGCQGPTRDDGGVLITDVADTVLATDRVVSV